MVGVAVETGAAAGRSTNGAAGAAAAAGAAGAEGAEGAAGAAGAATAAASTTWLSAAGGGASWLYTGAAAGAAGGAAAGGAAGLATSVELSTTSVSATVNKAVRAWAARPSLTCTWSWYKGLVSKSSATAPASVSRNWPLAASIANSASPLASTGVSTRLNKSLSPSASLALALAPTMSPAAAFSGMLTWVLSSLSTGALSLTLDSETASVCCWSCVASPSPTRTVSW